MPVVALPLGYGLRCVIGPAPQDARQKHRSIVFTAGGQPVETSSSLVPVCFTSSVQSWFMPFIVLALKSRDGFLCLVLIDVVALE